MSDARRRPDRDAVQSIFLDSAAWPGPAFELTGGGGRLGGDSAARGCRGTRRALARRHRNSRSEMRAAAAVADTLHRNSDVVQQCDEQIRHRRVLRIAEVAPPLYPALSPP